MFITDAQAHIWGPNTPEHPWSKEGMERHSNVFGVDDLIAKMAEGDVERAVIVTPSWFTGNSVSLKAAAEYPGRFGVMGTFDFLHADPNEVTSLREQPGMLGYRLNLLETVLHDLNKQGRCDEFFAIAQKSRVPLMIYSPGEAPAISDIARRYPDLRLIVDHLNLGSKIRNQEIGPDLETLLPLSEMPNVAVKLSTLPLYVTEDYPYPSLHPYIKRVVDGFGVDRCMWGSDITRLKRSYVDCVHLMTEAVDFLTESDKQQIMDGSVSHWLDWPHDVDEQ